MSTTQESDTSAGRRCPRCSSRAVGRYCSNCGAELVGSTASPLDYANDYFSYEAARDFLKVVRRIAVSPVATTLALVSDLTSKQSASFLSFGLGVYAAATIAAVFTIRGPGYITEALGSALLFLGVCATTAGSFVLLRRVSDIPRTTTEYAKLMAILVGFSSFVYGLVGGMRPLWPRLSAVAIILVSIPLYVYYVRAQSRFWSLRPVVVIGYWIVAVVIAGFVISPPMAGIIYLFGPMRGSDLALALDSDSLSNPENLRAFADQTNKLMPLRLNADAEVQTVLPADNELIYHVRYLNLPGPSITSEQRAAAWKLLRDSACSDPGVREVILNEGVTLSYVMHDKQNRNVETISLTSADCWLPSAPRR